MASYASWTSISFFHSSKKEKRKKKRRTSGAPFHCMLKQWSNIGEIFFRRIYIVNGLK